jgi:transcription elongation factor Elf1
LPRRKKNSLDKIFEFLFGELAPLARNIFHHTTTYIFIAACIFCAKYVVARLFEPTDEVASYLHVIDTYGTLLLLTGFLIWITIDIILLIRKHLRGEHDAEEQDEEDQDRR